ncbi:VOC family protein [Kineosporia sp. J2-2]|uniref:VOC family protein n=1 Tax=Kineosporia corallincola TaxID=2835133 RepID=A0ABS5TQV8_9ACTN|nr:VOC family protein [Kineosporia corallincola]MBT0772856.1 VOC family protein [Kineosporia corallincola]
MTTTQPDFTGSRIDHLNIAVPDLPAAVAFYEPVLAVIGIVTMMTVPASDELPAMHGFGWPHKPYFWLIADGTVGSNMHLAFTVDSREQVRLFHRTALAHGATSLHAPGDHPAYHPAYYGGFVVDPHGINLEAVTHTAES